MTKAEEIQHVIGHLRDLEAWAKSDQGRKVLPRGNESIVSCGRWELEAWLTALQHLDKGEGE